MMLSPSFFNFTHPPHFLLYLHLYFTPSLTCCLSVMWSRTDAGSPNCGTAISALLWLLGSLSETGLGDAPPSPSASKKKRERGGERVAVAIRPSAKIQMIPPNFSVFRMRCFTSAVQQSILWVWGVLGGYRFVTKTQVLTNRTAWQISTVIAAHLLMSLWWKMLCADFVLSHLEWSLPCVATTVGCWQAAQVWDIGRGVRLLGRSCMICIRATVSHGSGCSMWLWRTTALLINAQWWHFEASVAMMSLACTCGRHTCYGIYKTWI